MAVISYLYIATFAKKRPEELRDDLQYTMQPVVLSSCCRFGYPKEVIENTYIRDDNGKPELVTVRNDPFVNPHVRLQLQGWRANVELISMNTALQYISKYASWAILFEGESTIYDWKVHSTRFADAPTVLSTEFSDATFGEADVENLTLTLNWLVTRINAVHTGGNEARKANSDLGKRTWGSIIVSKRCESYAQV